MKHAVGKSLHDATDDCGTSSGVEDEEAAHANIDDDDEIGREGVTKYARDDGGDNDPRFNMPHIDTELTTVGWADRLQNADCLVTSIS
uniref:Uncharacterized protein n=1 Tax=Mesocestoides corti TaxID=53468 RepID=A0A5K3G0P6_MESCO